MKKVEMIALAATLGMLAVAIGGAGEGTGPKKNAKGKTPTTIVDPAEDGEAKADLGVWHWRGTHGELQVILHRLGNVRRQRHPALRTLAWCGRPDVLVHRTHVDHARWRRSGWGHGSRFGDVRKQAAALAGAGHDTRAIVPGPGRHVSTVYSRSPQVSAGVSVIWKFPAASVPPVPMVTSSVVPHTRSPAQSRTCMQVAASFG